MIIEIVTRRTLDSDDFWSWANNTMQTVNSVANRETRHMALRGEFKAMTTLTRDDFKQMLETGEFSFSDKLDWTEVKTTYRIIER